MAEQNEPLPEPEKKSPDSTAGPESALPEHRRPRPGLEMLKHSDDPKDIRLMRRAQREGWGLDARAKKVVRNRLVAVVAKEADLNHVIQAAKVLVEADKVDIAADKNDIQAENAGKPQQHNHLHVTLTPAERAARVLELIQGQCKTSQVPTTIEVTTTGPVEHRPDTTP
jgi:hypothetical protein